MLASLKILSLSLVLSLCAFTDSRPPVDYAAKALKKELKKSNILSFEMVEEIGSAQWGTGKFFRIKDNASSNIKYVYVGRVNSCRAGGCSNPELTDNNSLSEYFDYFIFFNKQKEVLQVKVFNYQASHGYEITAKGWLKQFIGYNGKTTLRAGKEIDSISGATISVDGIIGDIQLKTASLQSME